jgi:hypothetical protein
MTSIIDGIRQVSDADILVLEGTANGQPVHPIYRTLGYEFARVLMLDVKDCIWVEVENPLEKPLAVTTFWVPNVVLSSDYLITVSPLKIVDHSPSLSINNLASLLPVSKYQNRAGSLGTLYSLGMEKVLADLYFTLPFDLGIIEARQKLVAADNPAKGEAEDNGKIFIGEPYQIDREASQALGLRSEYLDLIDAARVELGT